MRCEECRDAISARMDGEDAGVAGEDVERHLAGCAPCRGFADRAARVTRLTRIRPAEPDHDVLPGLLAALDAGTARPAPPRGWRAVVRDAVRVALAVLGVGQLALAISGVIAAAGTSGGSHRLAGASMAHLSHESAAWNLALGVAFLWVASGAARRIGGLVPVIGAFVGLLVALSVLDLATGHVDPGRLAGHVPVVAGLVLLLVHARLGRGGGGTTGTSRAGARRSAARHLHDDRPDGGHADGGLQPTAHHRAA
ncbi:zf-HC2 domain-containing protein [Pseudonocardia kunmingensis]|uniref:Putative anti-sigma-YlaC factor YlaD n=1 Tax=Pseudonocardia kunmingensis TaxID=630975 RepID=A0A543DRV6_9PSEU|nr:zf-HC2 domain-containing protein [Pseudonocardia kunmingensis]TQM12067.1 putative anti-sigma-YlaC factor YlaD [Pseudonocardia kunmingensis]